MQTMDLPGRGTVAYQWSGNGPEIVALINGSVFNYQWDRQAMSVLNRGLGQHCQFLQYDYIGVGGSSAKTKPFSMLDIFRYFVEGVSQDAPAFARELPNVSGIPILLLNGTADTTTPVHMSRELAEIIPEAELVEFDGVTHMGPMLLKRDGCKVIERYVEFMKEPHYK